MLRRLLNRLSAPGRKSATTVLPGAVQPADRLITLGNEAEHAGDFRQACALYQQAIAAAPHHAGAHLNLGTALEAIGDTEGAALSYQEALKCDPAHASASYNLGRLLHVRGDAERAEVLLRAALASRPEFPEALVVLAGVQDARGDPTGAAVSLEAALGQRPDWLGALVNYAAILQKLGRLDETERVLRRVAALDPQNAEAMQSLGGLLLARGQLVEAERWLRLVLERRPELTDTYGTLFHVYEAQGRLDDAASVLEAALVQRPDWVDALHNYGTMLRKLRRYAQAEAAFQRAVALAPEYAVAREGLAGVYFAQGRIDDAVAAVGNARELAPQRFDLESTELFILNHSDRISVADLVERHRSFGRRLENEQSVRFDTFRNSRDSDRRLRVGYVSGDFNHHPVTFFLLPLLEHHDRSAFEISCYSVGVGVDQYTERVRACSDAWGDVARLSADELADLVHKDAIDILIDLSGHSGASRLVTFARQPAPVQVSWLGYPSTTGMTRIQYRICDAYTDPPGRTEQLYTEKLIRLAGGQWCYRPLREVPVSGDMPCRRNGHVTFGSFNQAKKLSPSVCRLWAEILRTIPDARLVIAGVPEAGMRERLLARFLDSAVDADRISYLGHVDLDEYFRRYNDVDIALDTTPYSGCTTTFDTLWMGVPVLTLCGEHPASMVTAGILSALGLEDWITRTPDGYVRCAIELARAPEKMEEVRASLRRRLRDSPFMDPARFAREMEAAYRAMWQAWCQRTA